MSGHQRMNILGCSAFIRQIFRLFRGPYTGGVVLGLLLGLIVQTPSINEGFYPIQLSRSRNCRVFLPFHVIQV